MRCLEEVISDALGPGVLSPFLNYLLIHHDVAASQIPHRFETVFDTIDELFGRGSIIIRKMIVRRFYTRLGLEFTESNCSMIRCIEMARMMHQENESARCC